MVRNNNWKLLIAINYYYKLFIRENHFFSKFYYNELCYYLLSCQSKQWLYFRLVVLIRKWWHAWKLIVINVMIELTKFLQRPTDIRSVNTKFVHSHPNKNSVASTTSSSVPFREIRVWSPNFSNDSPNWLNFLLATTNWHSFRQPKIPPTRI